VAWTVRTSITTTTAAEPAAARMPGAAARRIVLGGSPAAGTSSGTGCGVRTCGCTSRSRTGRLSAVEPALRTAVAEFVAAAPREEAGRGGAAARARASGQPRALRRAAVPAGAGQQRPVRPRRRSTRRLRRPEGLEVARRFLCGSSRLVLGWLASRRDDPSSLAEETLLDLLVLLARYLRDTEGIDSSYLSYRSHSEAFLNTFDRDGRLRAAFDDRYQAQAPAVRAVAAAYLRPGPISRRRRRRAGWSCWTSCTRTSCAASRAVRSAPPRTSAAGPPASAAPGSTASARPISPFTGRQPAARWPSSTPGARLPGPSGPGQPRLPRAAPARPQPAQKYLACHMVRERDR